MPTQSQFMVKGQSTEGGRAGHLKSSMREMEMTRTDGTDRIKKRRWKEAQLSG